MIADVSHDLAQCEREIAAAEATFRESGELAHYVWLRDWQREHQLLHPNTPLSLASSRDALSLSERKLPNSMTVESHSDHSASIAGGASNSGLTKEINH